MLLYKNYWNSFLNLILLLDICHNYTMPTKLKIHTWSLKSVSWCDRVDNNFWVLSSCNCKVRISFCSPSPSSAARDIARILGNQSRLRSYYHSETKRNIFFRKHIHKIFNTSGISNTINQLNIKIFIPTFNENIIWLCIQKYIGNSLIVT